MAGILNKQFNADILEANNILLNGVNIDNYSILSESSSNTINDISGDFKIVDSFLNSKTIFLNLKPTYIKFNIQDGIDFTLNGLTITPNIVIPFSEKELNINSTYEQTVNFSIDLYI